MDPKEYTPVRVYPSLGCTRVQVYPALGSTEIHDISATADAPKTRAKPDLAYDCVYVMHSIRVYPGPGIRVYRGAAAGRPIKGCCSEGWEIKSRKLSMLEAETVYTPPEPIRKGEGLRPSTCADGFPRDSRLLSPPTINDFQSFVCIRQHVKVRARRGNIEAEPKANVA
jgi:hypothetical protein